MTLAEFDQLWNEEDKCIMEDIQFGACNSSGGSFCFEKLQVVCQSGMPLEIYGTYQCETGAITYNFVVQGIGPVTRYDAGGPEHKDATRFHRHVPQSHTDFRQNLPYAEPRADLQGRTAEEIWTVVCSEARISHTGAFFPPEVLCK